jgi:hypothetical protein
VSNKVLSKFCGAQVLQGTTQALSSTLPTVVFSKSRTLVKISQVRFLSASGDSLEAVNLAPPLPNTLCYVAAGAQLALHWHRDGLALHLILEPLALTPTRTMAIPDEALLYDDLKTAPNSQSRRLEAGLKYKKAGCRFIPECIKTLSLPNLPWERRTFLLQHTEVCLFIILSSTSCLLTRPLPAER